MIGRVALFLLGVLGVLFVSARDIPNDFVVAESDVYQGSDFQPGKAEMGHIQGVWHFGDSESEWSVAIIPYNEGLIVQTSSVFYSDKSENFLSIYAAANNPKFINGVIRIPKPHRENGYYEAMFIESKSTNPKTGKKTKMLLLDGNSMDSRKSAQWEAGSFSSTLKEWFGEQYASSCTILGENELRGKSAAELALMRNTIFARYGMIFSDPVLKSHFDKKVWYRPWKADVTDRISDLEWINIRNIQKQELQRMRQ